MLQIITKHRNRYKVFQILLKYNAHPYFSLKNLGKKSVHYIQQNTIVFFPEVQDFVPLKHARTPYLNTQDSPSHSVICIPTRWAQCIPQMGQ